MIFLIGITCHDIKVLLGEILAVLCIEIKLGISSFVKVKVVAARFLRVFTLRTGGAGINIFVTVTLGIVHAHIQVQTQGGQKMDFIVKLGIPDEGFDF